MNLAPAAPATRPVAVPYKGAIGKDMTAEPAVTKAAAARQMSLDGMAIE